jgi:hypothetical protein
MTTEEIIERYITEGYNALKKHTAKKTLIFPLTDIRECV